MAVSYIYCWSYATNPLTAKTVWLLAAVTLCAELKTSACVCTIVLSPDLTRQKHSPSSSTFSSFTDFSSILLVINYPSCILSADMYYFQFQLTIDQRKFEGMESYDS